MNASLVGSVINIPAHRLRVAACATAIALAHAVGRARPAGGAMIARNLKKPVYEIYNDSLLRGFCSNNAIHCICYGAK